MRIGTVTVIGANGTMGCGVAGIFASFGDAKVYMIAREIEKAAMAKEKAALSVKAQAIEYNLIPRTYDDLAECVSKSDLVFESVAEDEDLKKEIYSQLSKHLKPHVIFGTGTSGLSINELSAVLDDTAKRRFMGIHFFNPPYRMTLCEVIPSRYTDPSVLEGVKAYLRSVLHRDVVQVKDEPAFLANRIGFQFINEALQQAERHKDKGGIDYIDSIMGPFTGRSMAPLVTSDFVGLDVHKAIVDNIYNNTHDFAHHTFDMPRFALDLVSKGHIGRKAGSGLYKRIVNDDGSRIVYVYDIATGTYRPIYEYSFRFAEAMKARLRVGDYEGAFEQLLSDDSREANICVESLIKYAIYGVAMGKAIGEDVNSADAVMATGFNWVPPLALIDAFGGVDIFREIALERLPKGFFEMVDVEGILSDIPSSRYDFRPFFKAR